MSGTGLSLKELRETMASGISKDDVFVFHRLRMFDTWEKAKAFIERYVPASLKPPSGYLLQKRIQGHLIGLWVNTLLSIRRVSLVIDIAS